MTKAKSKLKAMNRGAPPARTTEENEPLIETEENLAYIQVCPEHPLFTRPYRPPRPRRPAD